VRRNSVENFFNAKPSTKGFDLKSATPIRETDLDGFYALSASANKIDGASADTRLLAWITVEIVGIITC
jgi:hypothetical protein